MGRLVVIYSLMVFGFLLGSGDVGAAEPPIPVDVPADWRLISTLRGVWVLEKSGPVDAYPIPAIIPDKALHYLVVVRLDAGRLRSLSGDPQRGCFSCKQIEVFWDAGLRYNTESSKLKVVLSGTFFGADPGAFLASRRYPTWANGISFGLKRSGTVLDLGNRMAGAPPADAPFPTPDRVRLLVWNDEWSNIIPYSRAVFEEACWPQIVGGLDPELRVQAGRKEGRSLVGVRDLDGDGKAELVMFYLSNWATQEEATTGLERFRVDRMMLLDGSNTAQIIVDGEVKVKHFSRPFPHAFAVYGGK